MLPPNCDPMLAGAATGFVSRALVAPFDVVKIRLQLQTEPIGAEVCINKISSTWPLISLFIQHHGSKYRGIAHAIRTMAREEGLSVFWKGHVPAQILSVGYSAVQVCASVVFFPFPPHLEKNPTAARSSSCIRY